jgi:hypothetical protein
VRDGHREVAVADVDMHLGTADELLTGEQLVLVEHVLIARVRRDLERLQVGDGHGTGRHDAHAQPFGRGDDAAAQRGEVLGQVDEPDVRATVRLHDRPLQLRAEPVAGKLREKAVGARNEPPCLQVDRVELFLDPDRDRSGAVCHSQSVRRVCCR